jgi:pectate lyase
VSLRKFSDGRVSVLDTAPFAVRLGAWYRLRLETVGSQVRGYVNGSQLLEATDTSLTSGRVGLVTSRAAAEFEQFRAIQP